MSATQKVIPVQVPWMISPSTPYLRLIASESAYNRPTQVSFIGHFGLEASEATLTNKSLIQICYSPHDSNVKLGPKSGPFQLVRVMFNSGLWSRILPSYSDTEVVNPLLYDFSDVPCSYESGQSIDLWLSDFQKTWVQNQSCPDPRMYEVEGSLWLREIGTKDRDLKHYLLLGHDAYVEVIAKEWEWNSEGSLR